MKQGLEIVLRKMCEIAEIDYELVSFSDSSHLELTWGEEKSNSFRNWLSNELISNKIVRKDICAYPSLCRSKRYAERISGEFNLNFGFKIKV